MAKKRKDREPGAASPPVAPAAEDRLVRLIQAGENRAARSLATELRDDASSGEQVRAAAQEILRRTGIDPPALITGLAALAVVTSLVGLLFLG